MQTLPSSFQRHRSRTVPATLARIKSRNSQRLTCDICQRKYIDVQRLKYHKETHRPSRPDRSKSCPQCGKWLSYSTNLQDHLRQVHQGHKNCRICHRSFEPAHFLLHQLDCRNQNARKLTCAVCSRKLSSPAALRHHDKIFHQGLKRCMICFQYVEAAEHPQHWLSCQNRNDAPVLTCADCGQKLSSAPTLQRHHRQMHQGMKNCSFCRREFPVAEENLHQLECTMFRCNECGNFLPKSELTAHRKQLLLQKRKDRCWNMYSYLELQGESASH
jgi:transcription elongation factor Elf1